MSVGVSESTASTFKLNQQGKVVWILNGKVTRPSWTGWVDAFLLPPPPASSFFPLLCRIQLWHGKGVKDCCKCTTLWVSCYFNNISQVLLILITKTIKTTTGAVSNHEISHEKFIWIVSNSVKKLVIVYYPTGCSDLHAIGYTIRKREILLPTTCVFKLAWPFKWNWFDAWLMTPLLLLLCLFDNERGWANGNDADPNLSFSIFACPHSSLSFFDFIDDYKKS